MRQLSRFYKAHPALCLFTGAVIVPLFAAALWVRAYLIGTLPQTGGAVQVEGIRAPVSIVRDRHGVVRIEASDDGDAFFAMGYAHAQDRMWQLEVQRRMARGTLAEVFGKGAVNIDIYVRTLGLHANAAASWSALSEAAQKSLLAYAAGINQWLDEKHRLPVEFTVLGIRPQAWQPADSLAWMKMFALNLSGNYQQDLNRFTIAQAMSEAQYATLFGVTTQPSPAMSSRNVETATLDGLIALADVGAGIERDWRIGGRHVGSNAWVVSGKHSVGGAATLSNDPHLGLELPSLWYAVDIKGSSLDATGMSLVGLPLVMIGKNRHIGWGVTNMMADTMDLYFEQVNTENLDQYRRGDAWVDFSTHTESIGVRADFPSFLREPLAPIQIRVRRTDTGPVISDVIKNVEQPLSLRWVGDSPRDTSYDAFLQLNYAHDWSSFKQALSIAVSPALNVLYVDDEQNIGYLGVGKLPVRGRGNGSVPAPGWTGDFAWTGFIPANEMPQSYNPARGYIVSANNRVADDAYPYFISQDWAEPERAQRIERLILRRIRQHRLLGVADHQAIQSDTSDRQASEVLRPLLGSMAVFRSESASSSEEDAQIERMLAYLQAWDGDANPDSIAATIFFSWMRHLRGELFEDKLKAPWGNPASQRRLNGIAADVTLPRLMQALDSSRFDWCDRLATQEKETCAQIELDALRGARNELTKLLGRDESKWQWGNAHHAVYRHRPFSDVKGVDFLFERRSSRGGSPNTVNLSAFSFDGKDGYVQAMGPAFRQIVLFGSGSSRLLFMNATGQSGNVSSEHYDDMIAPFAAGRYYEASTRTEVSAQTLRLIPATDPAQGAP